MYELQFWHLFICPRPESALDRSVFRDITAYVSAVSFCYTLSSPARAVGSYHRDRFAPVGKQAHPGTQASRWNGSHAADILPRLKSWGSPRSGSGRPSHPTKRCVGPGRPTEASFHPAGVLRFVLGTSALCRVWHVARPGRDAVSARTAPDTASGDRPPFDGGRTRAVPSACLSFEPRWTGSHAGGVGLVVPSPHPVLQGQGYCEHRAVRLGGKDPSVSGLASAIELPSSTTPSGLNPAVGGTKRTRFTPGVNREGSEIPQAVGHGPTTAWRLRRHGKTAQSAVDAGTLSL